MTISHHATFLVSGSYSSVVISAKPRDEMDPTAKMEEQSLWGEDFVQLTESAIFFSLGSDAVNQPLSIYFALESDPERQPERKLTGTFTSDGEFVYLESIDTMMFANGTKRFFLQSGRYRVECHSWNLQAAQDHFSPYINTAFDNVRHEVFFIPA